MVELTYWGGPVGRTATVTLRESGGRKVKSVVATMLGDEPHALVPVAPTGPFPYPSYEILTAEGVTEVVEHRRMEPIFYVVDDPEVKKNVPARAYPQGKSLGQEDAYIAPPEEACFDRP